MRNIKNAFVISAFLPCLVMAWTAPGPAQCGKVAGYRTLANNFYFKIDKDPSLYWIQGGRKTGAVVSAPNTIINTTLTVAEKIEIRNSERSVILQAYSLGESVCFLREQTSSWGNGAYFEVDNISLGAI